MTDQSQGAKALADKEAAEAAEAERKLGRTLAMGLPAAAVGVALIVGTVTSAGPAILVLIAGALLGSIALVWGSLRTLGGDAPLSHELEAAAAHAGRQDTLAERKQTALRALKDLEHEHSIGKIDDEDFASLKSKYREEAKGVLRQLDLEIEPYREKAEALAKKHLAKVGLSAEKSAAKAEPPPDAEGEPTATKRTCPKCQTNNDEDAAFCKKCGASLAGGDEESGRAAD